MIACAIHKNDHECLQATLKKKTIKRKINQMIDYLIAHDKMEKYSAIF